MDYKKELDVDGLNQFIKMSNYEKSESEIYLDNLNDNELILLHRDKLQSSINFLKDESNKIKRKKIFSFSKIVTLEFLIILYIIIYSLITNFSSIKFFLNNIKNVDNNTELIGITILFIIAVIIAHFSISLIKFKKIKSEVINDYQYLINDLNNRVFRANIYFKKRNNVAE